MIQAQVFNRVFQVSGEEAADKGQGAGVILDIRGNQILFTAAHLTNNEPEEYPNLRAPFVNDAQWMHLPLARIGNLQAQADVAAFRLPKAIVDSKEYPLPFGTDGMVYTQEVYVLGHPYGLSLEIDADLGMALPLTKRGIVAGRLRNHRYGELILVDTIANPGFSGGPAVFEHCNTKKLTCMGIVKGQFMQLGPVPDGSVAVKVPAGVTAVTGIEYALRALEIAR